MGRTLKRVVIDFDWPLNKVWKGYINPIQPEECASCQGSGYSPRAQYLQKKWHGFERVEYVWTDGTHTLRWNKAAWENNLDQDDVQALLDADRLWDFTRVPRTQEHKKLIEQRKKEGHNSWLPFNNGYIPTPEEVNEWNKRGMGHDDLNAHVVIKAKIQREGGNIECSICQGEGYVWESPQQRARYDAWQAQEPPVGEGYQLWETGGGSPQSPVFATLDELCAWCEMYATTFADRKTTAEAWKQRFLDGMDFHREGNSIFI